MAYWWNWFLWIVKLILILSHQILKFLLKFADPIGGNAYNINEIFVINRNYVNILVWNRPQLIQLKQFRPLRGPWIQKLKLSLQASNGILKVQIKPHSVLATQSWDLLVQLFAILTSKMSRCARKTWISFGSAHVTKWVITTSRSLQPIIAFLLCARVHPSAPQVDSPAV